MIESRTTWNHMEIVNGVWQVKWDWMYNSHDPRLDYGATDGIRGTHEYDLRHGIIYGEGMSGAKDAGNGLTFELQGISIQGKPVVL